MANFNTRILLPEIMDQPGVEQNEIHKALEELETINKLLGGYHVIFNALEKIDWTIQPVSILDLGCGGGDLLRAIAKWARHKKRKVLLTGMDMNPVMTEFARKKSASFPEIQFITLNVFDERLLEFIPDVTMNSLFCHHFDNEELIELVSRMVRISKRAVIINDLHRHWFAYYSIKMIARLFSKTYLVKYDGPLSVARSLTRSEWKRIFSKAGIRNYRLKWMWAWRWQILIKGNLYERSR
jgi:ubiquinone/menaquinone biosynthesis C-methylase UbiE